MLVNGNQATAHIHTLLSMDVHIGATRQIQLNYLNYCARWLWVGLPAVVATRRRISKFTLGTLVAFHLFGFITDCISYSLFVVVVEKS